MQGQEKKKGASNPMQLLAKAEAEKQKLERLKSEDPEKAKAQIEKEQWKKAMLKAEGVKVCVFACLGCLMAFCPPSRS